MIYWVLVLAWFLFAVPVEAKNLYVNNSGSPACDNATTYANNDAANPWCSLDRAVSGNTRASPSAGQAAAAGDVVYVTPGTYTVAGHADKYPYYNPVNSGTSGNLITFQSSVPGTYVDLTFSSGSGGMIGAHDVNYIKWKGFRIQEASALSEPDTGPIVVWGCTGCVIDSNYVDGNGDAGGNDNHNGVRLDNATNISVINNYLTNIHTSGVNARNGAGVMAYSTQGSTIEHNTIWNVGTCVYMKGAEDGFQRQHSYTIRYNLCHDTIVGAYASNFNDAAGGMTNIYQNVVYTCSFAGLVATGDVSGDLHNVTIYNNTVHACEANLMVRTSTNLSNITFRDNISTNGGAANESGSFGASESTTHAGWSADYNMYYNRDRWSFNGSVYTTIGTWRTAISDEANSSVQDPLYVVSGSNFHLQGGSPALTASSTAGPVGAYVTGTETIGVETGQSPGAVISGSTRFTGAVRIQ